ncbi:2OG-Fe(II) oxygenase [Dactylosporangium sp. NPDC049140]|uniref:2OG-Fe(II) oxygenase n=1 Tax=Dactylosporangium sp. NPDC049140 TaxID=3155647 RepID=UPI0033F16409
MGEEPALESTPGLAPTPGGEVSDIPIVWPGEPIGPTPIAPADLPYYLPHGPTPIEPIDTPHGPTPIEPIDLPFYLPAEPVRPGEIPGVIPLSHEPGQVTPADDPLPYDPRTPGSDDWLVDPRALWLGDHQELAVELPEFLAVPELELIRGHMLEHESQFEPSIIMRDGESLVDPDSRRSVVLEPPGAVARLIRDRVAEALPYVLARLGLHQVRPGRIDVQLTVTNDGGFFRTHSDSSTQGHRTRRLSYVYFCHADPTPFTGGELKVWATERYSADPPEERCHTVVPRQNTVVFFRGSLLHEVTPVRCPGGAFADGRFTANGWIHW